MKVSVGSREFTIIVEELKEEDLVANAKSYQLWKHRNRRKAKTSSARGG